MPVIVASEEAHPFLPSLASGSAIDQRRALQQDIRPLEIAILNLMADKMTTERQLAAWLGSTPLQVSLTFVATDGYVRAIRDGRQSKTTPAEHIVKFYKPLSEIRADKFDGLIVTGVNALQPRVSDEAFWPEVQEILDWSASHVLSSLYLCWGPRRRSSISTTSKASRASARRRACSSTACSATAPGLRLAFPMSSRRRCRAGKIPTGRRSPIARRWRWSPTPRRPAPTSSSNRKGSASWPPLSAPRLCAQSPRIRNRLARQ